MGTRSMIGMACPRNEVHYVFVFMDGFPSWNGSILTGLGTREFVGTLPEGGLSHIEEDGTRVRAARPPYIGAEAAGQLPGKPRPEAVAAAPGSFVEFLFVAAILAVNVLAGGYVYKAWAARME